jgi:hypothetical protein
VCGRQIKPKEAYITISGAFKGIGFRKLTMKCLKKWGQYEPENAKRFI